MFTFTQFDVICLYIYVYILDGLVKSITQNFNLSQEGQHFLLANLPIISSQIDADPLG